MPTGVRKRLGEPKGQRPGVSVAPCESRPLALGAANAILITKNPSLASGWSYEWDGVPSDRRVWKEHAVPFRESTGPVYMYGFAIRECGPALALGAANERIQNS